MTGTRHLHGPPGSGAGTGSAPDDSVGQDLTAARILRLLAHERRTALADRPDGGEDPAAPR